jgi:ribose-phosphate pyrophosphokinase
MEDVVLLANPRSQAWSFAKKIRDHIRENKEEEVDLKKLDITRFNDKEILPHVPENIRKKDVYFIHSPNKNPADWLTELILTKDLCLSASVNSLSFVLPKIRYDRQDRKHKSRVPISSRAIANSISPGLQRIITMDLHSAQIQNAYPANCPIDNLYSFPEVVKHIRKNHPSDLENLAVISPDAGGVDRAASFLRRLINANYEIDPKKHDYSFAFTHKLRPKPGEIGDMWLIGDVKGKNALIIDDIYDTGGTNIRCAELLRENGAKKIMTYATHGLFTKGVDKIANAFDLVMTSNTYYKPKNHSDKIEVIDVTPSFAEAIYRAQKGFSISKMFD